jgi:hypothetical protein
MEDHLSRIINTMGVGRERQYLLKAIVISIRELMKQTKPDSTSLDLSSFVSIALVAVGATIERTVAPWEKRDYWVKADKFRREWAWVDPIGKELKDAILNEDWPKVATLSTDIGVKLRKIEVSERHRMGTPWIGSWDKLREKN